ncbi:TIGR03936 family radical SAM-associated protein [Nocardioides sp.]|uniref:TIGR03936 family radical SAM-associated protein n=1 Tax=Nocardioides sp. TaxID=35761 RepID=UPI00356B2BA9
MSARQPPEQQAPPVQRLRVRYAKRGRLRFTSHRDFSRAFERAVFRARVPMAYSSGFNPHPRISYAGASPTGSASEAEYLELALAEVVDPATIHASLSEALPDGLDIVTVVVSAGGSLADLLEASRWRLDVPGVQAEVEADVAAFLAAEELVVERMTKKGLRQLDARAPVAALRVVGAEPPTVSLELLLRHQVPAVRPDDVLSAMAAISGRAPLGVALLTRLEQGPFDAATGRIGDPLDPRAAS